LAQLVRIVEESIQSDRITISPPLFCQDELRRRLIITLNMFRVARPAPDHRMHWTVCCAARR